MRPGQCGTGVPLDQLAPGDRNAVLAFQHMLGQVDILSVDEQPPPRGPVWRQVCGTGHRELDPKRYNGPEWDEDIWVWVRRETRRVLTRLRDDHDTEGGISGMARGFDLELFDAVVATDGVKPHACAPFPQQCEPWSKADQARWHAAIARAETVHYVGDVDGVPPKERGAAVNRLLFDRNDVMLLAADVVVALYDPARNHNSGTHDTVEKARGKRRLRDAASRQRIYRPIIHLNPATRRVGILQDHMPADQHLAAVAA